VALPPVVATPTPGSLALTGVEIFSQLCSHCHGSLGEGGIGPALNTDELKQPGMDKQIFDAINNGTPSTPMIAWGKFLSADQIDQLVQFILGLGNSSNSQVPAFSTDVMPIFQASCTICHGTLGGWTATSYSSVMTSGIGGSVVIPGDAPNSLLVQKLKGTQQIGSIMPPIGKLSDSQIQVIIDWINAGALEK
jgi:cbb3-type cytochrome c oxidase subunit III